MEGPSKHNTLEGLKEKYIKYDRQKKKKKSTGETSPETAEKKKFITNILRNGKYP